MKINTSLSSFRDQALAELQDRLTLVDAIDQVESALANVRGTTPNLLAELPAIKRARTRLKVGKAERRAVARATPGDVLTLPDRELAGRAGLALTTNARTDKWRAFIAKMRAGSTWNAAAKQLKLSPHTAMRLRKLV
jgi:hypothetical protein